MNKLIKILIFIRSIAEDIFISLGLALITLATFMINIILGIYIIGFIFLYLGIIIAKNQQK